MRDYAKKPYRPARRKNNSNGGWILISLILCALFFIFFITYHLVHQKLLADREKPAIIAPIAAPVEKAEKKEVKKIALKIKNKPQKIAKKTTSKKVVAVKKEKDIALNPADEQPKYDFYKLLPETTVTIPKQDLSPKPVNTAAIQPDNYVLQIASLQTEDEATQVQTAMTTLKYKTFVQAYQAPDHTTWYHVMVGPLTLASAKKEQSELDSHQIEASLLKNKTTT
ncbi:MAG: SPOR domain-containing protein [Gammaproteobacteria bacterium]|nr:SPOR domain-containing protein [Gammaproteobacteria bacterium]